MIQNPLLSNMQLYFVPSYVYSLPFFQMEIDDIPENVLEEADENEIEISEMDQEHTEILTDFTTIPEKEQESYDSKSTSTTQENLEEIVSHLLQHNLHLQQLLLSKQRRAGSSLFRKMKQRRLLSYGTSDTEDEDFTSRDSGLTNTERSITPNSITVMGGAMESRSVVGQSEYIAPLENIDVNETYSMDSSGALNLKRFYEEGNVVKDIDSGVRDV